MCDPAEQSTLTDIKVDNAENETFEKLQTEVAALKSERNKDKETICKLNKDIAQLLKQELDEMNQQDGESSHLLPPPKSSSLHKRLSPLTSSALSLEIQQKHLCQFPEVNRPKTK